MDSLEKYDGILNEVIIKFYYKHHDVELVIPKIEQCIAENNYLKPIFEMLLIIIKLSNSDFLQRLDKEYTIAYDYLKGYKKMFDVYPINNIYYYLYLLTLKPKALSDIRKVEIENDFKALIYNAQAVNAYHNNQYELSLFYAYEANKMLLEDFNYERSLILNFTYYGALNYVGEYNITEKYAFKQLIYLYDINQTEKLRKITRLHLYNAMIGNSKYYEIIRLSNKIEKQESIDYIYMLIAYYNLDKGKYNNLKENLSLTETTNEVYLSIISILEETNSEIKKEKIKRSIINKNLKKY